VCKQVVAIFEGKVSKAMLVGRDNEPDILRAERSILKHLKAIGDVPGHRCIAYSAGLEGKGNGRKQAIRMSRLGSDFGSGLL
jgi:hypothetical protein